MRGGAAPGYRGTGPSRLGLLALGLSAIAFLATSQVGASIARQVTGEVVLGGDEHVDRTLHIHVGSAGGGASGGSLGLTVLAPSGLGRARSDDVSVSLVAASDALGTFDPESDIPVARCAAGCDLSYTIRVAAASGVLPGSFVRYSVEVRLYYDNRQASPDGSALALELDGATTAPVTPLWSLLAGLLAVLAGIAAGPLVERGPGRRRRWPTLALVMLGLGAMAWNVATNVVYLFRYVDPAAILSSPRGILAVADPWSMAVLGTLTWGVWRGVVRRPADGGWLLGMAAVAATGLGGLWLAWSSTLGAAAVQPVGLGVLFAVPGLVGGMVIGQAWRTDPIAKHDRWWVTFAVLGHGIIVAGFAYIAADSILGSFELTDSLPTLAVTVLPMTLVLVGFRRWLRGRRAVLAWIDVLVAAAGVLGLLVWLGLGSARGGLAPLDMSFPDVGALLAIAASLVALVTAFHALPKPASPTPPAPAPADDRSTT